MTKLKRRADHWWRVWLDALVADNRQLMARVESEMALIGDRVRASGAAES